MEPWRAPALSAGAAEAPSLQLVPRTEAGYCLLSCSLSNADNSFSF